MTKYEDYYKLTICQDIQKYALTNGSSFYASFRTFLSYLNTNLTIRDVDQFYEDLTLTYTHLQFS